MYHSGAEFYICQVCYYCVGYIGPGEIKGEINEEFSNVIVSTRGSIDSQKEYK